MCGAGSFANVLHRRGLASCRRVRVARPEVRGHDGLLPSLVERARRPHKGDAAVVLSWMSAAGGATRGPANDPRYQGLQ